MSTVLQRSLDKFFPLESVQVENFKAIKTAVIPLARVTILVGPNRSGKSSVLQAIHWAARVATHTRTSPSHISSGSHEYWPSAEPLMVGHDSKLKSDTKSPPVSVMFKQTGGDSAQVTVRMWAAQNEVDISAHIEGGSAVSAYRQRTHFVTAYIPGLAGLSHREELLSRLVLGRRAAVGDAGSVLRNILYNLAAGSFGSSGDLTELNQWISKIHPDILLDVIADDPGTRAKSVLNGGALDKIYLSATIEDPTITNSRRPLESAATGVLQVTQIFAYLLLFRPKIMLIDEPDAHLHPDMQERLIETLEKAAAEFGAQIVLTTHSLHVVRAASPDAKLVWMRDGNVKAAETGDDDAIRLLLGWGGLDKQVLMFVEDENDQAVRSILRQWPDLCRSVAICRTFGVDNLPKNRLLDGLLAKGKGTSGRNREAESTDAPVGQRAARRSSKRGGVLDLKAIVHRDRDFMTPDDMQTWEERYRGHSRVRCWITTDSDVEAYFCDPNYLAALYGVSVSEAQKWVAAAAKKVSRARETFIAKRKAIVRVLYRRPDGDEAEALWDDTRQLLSKKVVGKQLLNQLKLVVKNIRKDDERLDDKLLDKFQMATGYVMAPELKAVILALLTPTSTGKQAGHRTDMSA